MNTYVTIGEETLNKILDSGEPNELIIQIRDSMVRSFAKKYVNRSFDESLEELFLKMFEDAITEKIGAIKKNNFKSTYNIVFYNHFIEQFRDMTNTYLKDQIKGIVKSELVKNNEDIQTFIRDEIRNELSNIIKEQLAEEVSNILNSVSNKIVTEIQVKLNKYDTKDQK
jgi:hypothetical protein